MRISNKPNIVTGSILLLIAAFFSISLALIPLDFGAFGPSKNSFLYITALTLGDMLFSVYGFSSILIPIFLFIAGLSCFASKWTSKKSMRLLTAVIPFFTAVFVEKICRYFAEDYTDDFSSVKIVIALVAGLMLVIMEIIGAGLIADRVNDMIFHKEKFKAEDEKKDAFYEPLSTEEINRATEPTVDQSAKTELPYFDEEKTEDSEIEETACFAENSGIIENAESSSEPTLESEPTVQKEDPFANLFEEDEQANSISMITQEEYAALNNFSEENSDDENIESQLEDELEWPDADEIKIQAGAPKEEDSFGMESEENEPDEFIGNLKNSAENAKEDQKRQNFQKVEPDESENFDDDFESALNDFEKYNNEIEENKEFQDDLESENTDEDFEIENDIIEEKPTLDPDFFDIDMNSEEQADFESSEENEFESENLQENFSEPDEFEKKYSDKYSDAEEDADNSENSEPEIAQDEPKNENFTGNNVEEANPTISLGSDVFADMENDARKQLESSEDEDIFEEPEEFVKAENEPDETDNSADSEDLISDGNVELPADETAENNDEREQISEEPTLEGKVVETVPMPERKTIATEQKTVSHVARPKKPYIVPTDLLEQYQDDQYWLIDNETKESALKLKKTLSDFGISAEVIGIKKGPVVTMFEIAPAPGVKLSKIVALQDNIALSLAASSVRIVAPIPGKAAVGIEVPNKKRSIVSFREMIEQDLPEFQKMAVPVILGKDILGKSQIIDIAKTPHLLIAGATGAGKSVCVNSIILSILYKRSPQQVKMILVDPKVVELKLYNDIPHLLTPVVTEPKKALQVLQWCLCEMERRYALLDQMGVRDISSYNKRIEERHIATEKLPYIVIIIDEFADLMATSGKELESNVARLAAMSRAVGIHLVLATQRPSVNVITGLIKANIPSRIAFMVASRTDSNIIIDAVGAEKLLGKGDMLYASAVAPYPVRIQGTFESDSDVEKVVEYVKTLGEPDYIDDEIFVDDEDEEDGQGNFYGDDSDPLYEQALDIVLQSGKASASYIQRRLKVGYNRAARLVEEMEARGIVGPANGSKPREIIHVPS